MYERQRYILDKVITKAGIGDMLRATGGIIAGGALTAVFSGGRINDLDVFFQDAEQFNKARCIVQELPSDLKFQTDVALSYLCTGVPVQLIKKVFGNRHEVLRSFDFTVCMGAYEYNNNVIDLHERFLYDLANRNLVFNINAQYPIASMWRVRKYLARGFKIPAVELIKLALSIHRLTINSYADLREQLEGIDTLLLKSVTDALSARADDVYEFDEALKFMEAKLNEVFVGETSEEGI